MSRATRAYLKEQHAINEAQRIRPDPYGGMDSITADQKRAELIVQHPSMNVPSLPIDADARDRRKSEIIECSNVTVPSRGDYAKPNGNSSTRGQASVGPGGSPSSDTHTRSHSRASDSNMRDEGGRPVVNSSEEQDGSTIGNTSNCAKNAATLMDTKSTDHHPTSQDDGGDAWGDFRSHILHDPHQPVPIAMVNRHPTGSGPPFCLCRSRKELIIVFTCRPWALPRPPISARRCLAQCHVPGKEEGFHVCSTHFIDSVGAHTESA